MPDMNGVMLANKAQVEHPSLKVLIATGFTEMILDTSSESLPIIFKPFTQVELGQKVKSILRSASFQ